jgi:hypothetical protein
VKRPRRSDCDSPDSQLFGRGEDQPREDLSYLDRRAPDPEYDCDTEQQDFDAQAEVDSDANDEDTDTDEEFEYGE